MSLSPGTRLGSYEIVSLLGAGAMGQVYRAKDLKLKRDVAIKVLPEELATDSDRLRRFEQEARSASALNHPNIVTIYDIGGHGASRYIAMEYVEGKTLRRILGSGALPTKKLLQLAAQIAEGLARAHSTGIVHRDLKPENLMVTNDGWVKMLDFGLAKLIPESADGQSQMATMMTGTLEGTVLGTVGYMSPEQAAGRAADHRSDQFSLGVILYEMATGKGAFQRDSAAETLTAIIREEPEALAGLKPSLPFHFRWIVEQCLDKAPENRFDSTRDLARDLQSVLEGFLHGGEALSTVTQASTTGSHGEPGEHLPAAQGMPVSEDLAKLIASSKISIKNDIIHASFNRSDQIVTAINDTVGKIPADSDEVLFVNQGSGELTIICESDRETLFKDVFPEAVELRRRTAVLRIRESKGQEATAGIDVPGLYAFFINQLSKNNINLLDIISTSSQITLVIDEDDLTRAYSALNECIKHCRGREEAPA
ncbi:MAG: protein kinase [Thermoanaerobaculia bacterium]